MQYRGNNMRIQTIAIFAVLALLVACAAKTSQTSTSAQQTAVGPTDAVSSIGNDVASVDDMSNTDLSDDFAKDSSDIDNLELG